MKDFTELNDNALVDELVNDLKTNVDGSPYDWTPPDPVELARDEEKMLDVALEAIRHNLELNRTLLENASDTAQASGDAQHIESYASVTKSNVDLVKSLTEIMLKKQEMKEKREMFEMGLKSKEKIAQMKTKDSPKLGAGTTNIQNNFLFKGTPNEILKIMSAPTDEEKQKKIEELQAKTIDLVE